MTTAPVFHVVLHEPQIPNNTGNIGRTCIATGAALHLIHPLAFDTGEKACRRAGLDYWPRLAPSEHASWDDYVAATAPARPTRWLFSTTGTRPIWDAPLRTGDHLIFGGEVAGLPDELLDDSPERTLTFPMVPGERSLNLATTVCAAMYEGIRQLVARGDIAIGPDGRLGTDAVHLARPCD